jgi:hypothetical protein
MGELDPVCGVLRPCEGLFQPSGLARPDGFHGDGEEEKEGIAAQIR